MKETLWNYKGISTFSETLASAWKRRIFEQNLKDDNTLRSGEKAENDYTG